MMCVFAKVAKHQSLRFTIYDMNMSQQSRTKHTNRFDNSTELHQNSVDYDRKNTHCVVDQNTLVVLPDHRAAYPEIDLVYVIAFQTLSHLPEVTPAKNGTRRRRRRRKRTSRGRKTKFIIVIPPYLTCVKFNHFLPLHSLKMILLGRSSTSINLNRRRFVQIKSRTKLRKNKNQKNNRTK